MEKEFPPLTSDSKDQDIGYTFDINKKKLEEIIWKKYYLEDC
jgi:hypothetical protein